MIRPAGGNLKRQFSSEPRQLSLIIWLRRCNYKIRYINCASSRTTESDSILGENPQNIPNASPGVKFSVRVLIHSFEGAEYHPVKKSIPIPLLLGGKAKYAVF
jgi:hypothetical protein